MSNQRYPEEFKIEAVKQVTERGLRVADVAERLGVSAHSLYAWVKRYSKPQAQRQQVDDQQAELRRLRAELKRVTEERDILKIYGHPHFCNTDQRWLFGLLKSIRRLSGACPAPR